MNHQFSNTTTNLFGIFELSDDGTVLTSLIRENGRYKKPIAKMVGKDFFDEIADFENTFDLRKHFRNFITSRKSFDIFEFRCEYPRQTLQTRISMTRGTEFDYDHSNGIVIMDIRNTVL
jgi:hypothetical protein